MEYHCGWNVNGNWDDCCLMHLFDLNISKWFLNIKVKTCFVSIRYQGNYTIMWLSCYWYVSIRLSWLIGFITRSDISYKKHCIVNVVELVHLITFVHRVKVNVIHLMIYCYTHHYLRERCKEQDQQLSTKQVDYIFI